MLGSGPGSHLQNRYYRLWCLRPSWVHLGICWPITACRFRRWPLFRKGQLLVSVAVRNIWQHYLRSPYPSFALTFGSAFGGAVPLGLFLVGYLLGPLRPFPWHPGRAPLGCLYSLRLRHVNISPHEVCPLFVWYVHLGDLGWLSPFQTVMFAEVVIGNGEAVQQVLPACYAPHTPQGLLPSPVRVIYPLRQIVIYEMGYALRFDVLGGWREYGLDCTLV